MIYIGIDTGTHTGVAVWDSHNKAFIDIATMKIHEALRYVLQLYNTHSSIKVRFEDARKRTWFDTHTAHQDRAKLQGAGSIKRDCNIWEEFLTDMNIPFDAVAPKHNATKLSPSVFGKITGWARRTSEHSRDAAMLVYNF